MQKEFAIYVNGRRFGTIGSNKVDEMVDAAPTPKSQDERIRIVRQATGEEVACMIPKAP